MEGLMMIEEFFRCLMFLLFGISSIVLSKLAYKVFRCPSWILEKKDKKCMAINTSNNSFILTNTPSEENIEDIFRVQANRGVWKIN